MSFICALCSFSSSVSFCIMAGCPSVSGLPNVDLAKLCEHCNDKEDGIEDEEKDPVGPTQVEAAHRNNDEGQNQRQTQRYCENPRQQSLWFKLRRRKRQRSIMFMGSKTVSCNCKLYVSLYKVLCQDYKLLICV